MRFCLIAICCGTLAAAPNATGVDGSGRTVTSVVRPSRRTGKLVRSVVVAPQKSEAAPGERGWDAWEAVERAARHYDLDPLLVHAMIEVESGYNPFAISPKGAEGLMQLIPSTARRFGVTNSFNLTQNITGGVRYLRHLMDLFDDQRLAIAAYNAGEHAVRRYGGIPPYPETQKYVELVSSRYAAAKGNAIASDSGQAAERELYRPIEYFVDAEGRLHIRTR